MKILVTGASGFVGKNLVASFENVRCGYDRTREGVEIEEIMMYDVGASDEEISAYCSKADFVIHLAGVNRPSDPSDFRENRTALETLLKILEACGNRCPILLSGSVQATLSGRYAESAYGKSKLEAEKALFEYSKRTGAKVMAYRFPNIFGKWCCPNYNSAVATFCYNIARDLPIKVSDPSIKLELLYIDDLIDEVYKALRGRESRCEYTNTNVVPNDRGRYCYVPTTHSATLGEIVTLLRSFKDVSRTHFIPQMPNGSFEKKLFSTYLSYLPEGEMSYMFNSAVDDRGSFTELIKTASCGQFSVNVSKPGITKGEHWHNTKWELFIVVHGHGMIRERRIGSDEVIEFEVDGKFPQAVYMLPGYTHSIVNLSDNEELVTLMWANENFDPENPDTYRENV